MAADFTQTSIAKSITSAVAAALSAYDASHDIAHIERVAATASHIAVSEGVTDSDTLQVIHLSALLHDVADIKYSGSEAATALAAAQIMTDAAISSVIMEQVLQVIERVSYRKELDTATHHGALAATDPVVLAAVSIVQDADRLDAIGAVGIARAFTYGGAKNRGFYTSDDLNVEACAKVLGMPLTVEEYAKHSATTIGHFYAKLLRLKGMMKTETGQSMAAKRHEFMEVFLAQFSGEVSGAR